jgi:hypothetical protein
MTFEEAMEFRKKFGKQFPVSENTIGNVFIVPLKDSDLVNYLTDYRGYSFDDDTAKKYSSNTEFQVCSLWTDGTNVIKKVLKSE